MPTPWDPARSRRLRPALLGFSLLFACSRERGGGPAPVASVSAAPPPAATAPPDAATAPPDASAPELDVKPVYPVTRDAPDPLAARLCDALHALPVARKAACCGGAPGFHAGAECAQTLSFALRSGAVKLSPEDVDRCASAMERSLSGCAWASPLGAPLPSACDGIVKGALPEGARCRSSLECVDGLRCAGAGPTDLGTCRPPEAVGLCGASVDVLATYARQDGYQRAHPECKGHCATRRCADDTPIGGSCRSHVECGAGRRCVDGKCSDAPLPPAGAPCLAGLCAEGARCVKDRCVAPKGEDEACEVDAECPAACVRKAGSAHGVCAARCSRR